MEKHELFLKAIQEKKILQIRFKSFEKGPISRKCIPFDFGPSRRSKDQSDKYHFYDLDSPEGSHVLSILPEQLLEAELLEESFTPESYVTWPGPYEWFIKRDWGSKS
ncbi:hypothetical protein GOV14_07125 [Candidatus Pacearchaeota archaeon]|nr:hypothetical protein [Candidatus Pacearchaeota archaeon]